MYNKNVRALIKIINIHFWKSIIGPFFAFGFPIIFIAILGTMLGYSSMFGGLLAISAMSVSLTSMPQAIFEFKRSSLLKRIGVTPIKPWMFIVVAALFYMLVMLLGTFFSIAIGIAIFSSHMNSGEELLRNFPKNGLPLITYSLKDLLKNINWGGFIYGLLLNILVGTSVGMFLVSISKSVVMIQGIGIPILILSQFLSAQVLPINMVKPIDAIWYLGYISPFKSTTAIMLQSWNPSVKDIIDQAANNDYANGFNLVQVTQFNVFNIDGEYQILNKTGEIIPVFTKAERILNMIFPFLWAGAFSGLTLKFFKWSTRG